MDSHVLVFGSQVSNPKQMVFKIILFAFLIEALFLIDIFLGMVSSGIILFIFAYYVFRTHAKKNSGMAFENALLITIIYVTVILFGLIVGSILVWQKVIIIFILRKMSSKKAISCLECPNVKKCPLRKEGKYLLSKEDKNLPTKNTPIW